MFRYAYHRFRKSSFFEKLLLVVGIAVGIFGFWIINKLYVKDPILSWSSIIAVFLWMLLIFIVILTDSNESIKEELGSIMKEHLEETKLLKAEIKLVNRALTPSKRKR